MMTNEEVDEIVWEQKRQRAIKQLQELPRGQHFACIVNSDPEDHEKHQTIVVGCVSFVAECAKHLQSILISTLFGIKPPSES